MKDISMSRAKAEELYQNGISQLANVKELDGTEVIKAISHFHHLISIIEAIEIKSRISRDYTLLGMANIGLARAYGHVTLGIKEGDLESRFYRGIKFLEQAADADEHQKERNRHLSPHLKLSMLNGQLKVQEEPEQMERVCRI
ncbi:hypothetical protein [Legionella quateirensis]|uniref:Uncharacterized protein n=1 Tax=Legionella quateirensis TaxID=45072 RepID=A0A378KVX9_9GAMM|nr:hypothetical protein [Legionella quateirensis]KTD46493.1 hypothetical protein Lqua_2596 [Legionella quateirensis]STY18725.1 Uncharacterised protein [Legionella quateirensis]